MPTLSQDTVYRTLSFIEDEGFISRVEVLSDKARFDANMENHYHLICMDCGRVSDFYSKELDGFSPPTDAKAWGDLRSFHAEYRGVCAECKSKA